MSALLPSSEPNLLANSGNLQVLQAGGNSSEDANFEFVDPTDNNDPSKKHTQSFDNTPIILSSDIQEENLRGARHEVYTKVFGSLFHMPINEKLSQEGGRILEVGCGTGYWAIEVAENFPLAEVCYFVRYLSPRLKSFDLTKTVSQVVEKLSNFTFKAGNVLEGLPCKQFSFLKLVLELKFFSKVPDNYFDAVFQRMVIGSIPENKWIDEIRELKRVTKLGGYIELVEMNTDFQRIGPICQKFLDGINQASTAQKLYVVAPDLTRKITQGGLLVKSETISSFPVC
ncbi:hypothetical protein HK096_002601 [Nowakowskiella sp. JEL0078]|nr:hypothetical protein HK096_002601 [Nowakowskiella sp. JEL0078]